MDVENSSFRDPSGFLFYDNGKLYRQINQKYKEEYDQFMNSGLYDELVKSKSIVSHKESTISPFKESISYKIIEPEFIDHISYPYEWSFSQLKDAALLTLEIQKKSLEYNMSLKDCSAYNIQFQSSSPIFIDTLSFEKYDEGKPWKSYGQFCRHFLAPLSLMSHKDIRLNQLLRIFIDGIPLDLAAKLLPFKTFTSFSLLSHIHAHAKAQKKYEDKKINTKKVRMGKNSLLGIVSSLHSGIKKLNLGKIETEWGNYYSKTNYSEQSFQQKKEIVSEMIDMISPKTVWDLGANTGIFSRVASDKKIKTIAFDIDPIAVEKNYQNVRKNNEKYLLPLILDLTNPSSDIGWNNEERVSFQNRGPVDMILALALIHHLAISNNVPLDRIISFFAKITNNLLIEFVPKSDSQVEKLLATRKDIFDQYNKEDFEKSFHKKFEILKLVKIENSDRYLYLLKNISNN